MKDYDSKKWYNNRVLVFLFLTIFMIWPIGLFGLYLSKSLSKYQKGLYVIVAIIYHSLFYNVFIPAILEAKQESYEESYEETLPEDPRPSDQITFEEEAWAFIKSYSKAENDNNDLKKNQIKSNSVNFFRQQIAAKEWTGVFSELITFGEWSGDHGDDDFHHIKVISKSGFKYILSVTRHNKELNNYLINISKGAEISFSGLARQNALTPDRMIYDKKPIYKVKCTQIGNVSIGDLNSLKDSESSLRIGQLYDGGIIISVKNGHGLMIAPDDLGQMQAYRHHKPADGGGYGGTFTWFETMDILEELNYNGHNDWRLPTKDEWEFIETNKDNVDFNMGTFYGFLYWGSDEQEDILGDMSEAYQKSTVPSYHTGYMLKDSWGYVRLVRDF